MKTQSREKKGKKTRKSKTIRSTRYGVRILTVCIHSIAPPPQRSLIGCLSPMTLKKRSELEFATRVLLFRAILPSQCRYFCARHNRMYSVHHSTQKQYRLPRKPFPPSKDRSWLADCARRNPFQGFLPRHLIICMYHLTPLFLIGHCCFGLRIVHL